MKKSSFLIIAFSCFNLYSFQKERVFIHPAFFPNIGIYKGEAGYPTMFIDSNYSLDPGMIINGAPINLIKEVLKNKNIPTAGKSDNQLRREFGDKINFNNVYSYLIFEEAVPAYMAQDVSTQNRVYNVVFHPMISYWRNKEVPPRRGDFNLNQKMGLFTMPSGGIQPASAGIAINSLSDSSIHLHDFHYSPNNARFTLDTNRLVVTFWVVGLLTDINKISISLHVVFEDEGILQTIDFPERKQDLITSLSNILYRYPANNDIQAIREVINFLREKSAPRIPEAPKKSVQQVIQECLGEQEHPRHATSSAASTSVRSVEQIIRECLEQPSV